MGLNSRNNPKAERRQKPRIICNYPAMMQGFDDHGNIFEDNARVVNMSRGGAYALSRRPIQSGDVLTLHIAMPTGSLQAGMPKISTRAVVRHSESVKDGEVGIGVEFVNFKFILEGA